MTIANYSQLAVIEKALRQQPLTVAERRVAAHLATAARSAKEAALLSATFG